MINQKNQTGLVGRSVFLPIEFNSACVLPHIVGDISGQLCIANDFLYRKSAIDRV